MRRNEPLDVSQFGGSMPALFTPLKSDGSIDGTKLDQLIEDLIPYSDALVVAGTTGLGWALSPSEYISLVHHTFEFIDGRVPLIVAASSNKTDWAIEKSQAVEDRIGPTTFLHAANWYVNAGQEGVFAHHIAVADSIDGNVVVYRVDSRGSDLTEETIYRLSEHPGIIGVKYASGDIATGQRILGKCDPNEFKLVSGEDGSIAELGKYGVISATANAAPRIIQMIVDARVRGDVDAARTLQEEAKPIIDAVFASTNPQTLAGLFDSHLPSPLVRDNSAIEVFNGMDVGYLGMDFSKYR
jgi:4-hydroxy-tetrahydrodipicolinate synthase